MGLADRVAVRARASTPERRYSADTYLTDVLFPALGQFGYGGNQYQYGLRTSYPGLRVAEYTSDLPGHAAALRACPPAFAAQLVRGLVLSGARFTFRNPPWHRTPRRMFGSSALAPLERPWPNATTGELIGRMEWHAGLAGNAYVTNRRTPGRPQRLRMLRPDWTAIVYGSDQEPEDAAHALDGELIGYVYANGGLTVTGETVTGWRYRPHTLLPSEVAHWSPLPDPEASGIGMSWLTPAIREIQGDTLATQHKIMFFRNGATPNLVVKGIPAMTADQFRDIVTMLEEQHTGVANAYRTLYLTAGADATVIGSDMEQIDFKATQGAGETRLSVLSRVPAAILGISEGLQGSSLNAGNFSAARRVFADTWVYPCLQDLAAALAPMVRVPDDAELWFDAADIPLLREDAKDSAEIAQIEASTIGGLVREGFTAESAQAAVTARDMALLVHTNMVSVQLQPPGAAQPTGTPTRARGYHERDGGDDGDDLDEDTEALLLAMAIVAGEVSADDIRAWDPAKHPRIPKGQPGAGRFLSIVERVKLSLEQHLKGDGKGDPFDGYDREQLRKAAKARGISLKRGASRDDIAALLLKDLGGGEAGGKPAVKKATPAVKAPAGPTPTQLVEAGDFSALKRVGAQAGSNEGGVFEAADGSRWYVKAAKSPQHAANEAAAAGLYRAAGIAVPEVIVGTGAPGLSGGTHTATQLVPDATSDLAARVGDSEYLAKIRAGFAVDAWLANWDVAGLELDNIVTSGGDPHRIDVGGALLYRAQGAPKGEAFGDLVLEWNSLRDPTRAPQASRLFAGMTQEELASSAARVEAVTPAMIRYTVKQHGLPPELAATLIARRKNLLDQLNAPKAVQDWDAKASRAATGDAARDLSPTTVLNTELAYHGSAVLSDEEQQDALAGLAMYQGNGYIQINQYLRTGSTAGAEEFYARQVQSIDKVMNHSPLEGDTLVYRGIKDVTTIFGDRGRGDTTGLSWTELGYLSTSTNSQTAANFGVEYQSSDGMGGAVMRFVLPRGVNAVNMGDSWLNEDELLGQRGLKLRVVRDDMAGRLKVAGGKVVTTRLIDVEVVPA